MVNPVPPKSKRSLQFGTPNAKRSKTQLHYAKGKDDSLAFDGSINIDCLLPPSPSLSGFIRVESGQNNRKRGQDILEEDEIDIFEDPFESLGN